MLLSHSSDRLSYLTVMAGVLLCLDAAMASDVTKGTSPVSAGAAQQKACVDPATARLVSPEERPECKSMLDEKQGGARAESGEGHKEERLPDGSSKVDLQGRFEQQSQTPPVAPAPPVGDQIAIVDPQTGRLLSEEPATLMRGREALRATLEGFEVQLREMRAASQDTSGLQEEQLATGAVKIDLKGRFQSPLVARVGPDGTVIVDHENPPAK